LHGVVYCAELEDLEQDVDGMLSPVRVAESIVMQQHLVFPCLPVQDAPPALGMDHTLEFCVLRMLDHESC